MTSPAPSLRDTTTRPDVGWKGRRTRARVLQAAAGLFAEQGYAATTVRQIAAAAGVNVATISQYFGSKDGLYRDILDTGLTALTDARDQALVDCEGRDAPSVDRVVGAFLDPLYAMSRDPDPAARAFLAILSRSLVEADPVYRELAEQRTRKLSRRFVAAMMRAAPQLAGREIEQRFEFAVGAAAQALADPNRGNATRRGARRAALEAALTGFVVGGFQAGD